jgi:large subunit ribosomal protein L16
MTRYIKRGGKVWIRVFPHTPVTAKPNEVRMGSGKGSVSHYVAKIQAGTIIFELDGVTPDIAKEAMRLAGRKLPVKTRFVVREGAGE